MQIKEHVQVQKQIQLQRTSSIYRHNFKDKIVLRYFTANVWFEVFQVCCEPAHWYSGVTH